MTTALSSLPPKLIRLTEGAPPQEIKPEERDLADRVPMVKSRLAKATFTSQGDAKLVPELYEDYVKSIVGVLQTTLALAGAEAPPLSLPTLPSVNPPNHGRLMCEALHQRVRSSRTNDTCAVVKSIPPAPFA